MVRRCGGGWGAWASPAVATTSIPSSLLNQLSTHEALHDRPAPAGTGHGPVGPSPGPLARPQTPAGMWAAYGVLLLRPHARQACRESFAAAAAALAACPSISARCLSTCRHPLLPQRQPVLPDVLICGARHPWGLPAALSVLARARGERCPPHFPPLICTCIRPPAIACSLITRALNCLPDLIQGCGKSEGSPCCPPPSAGAGDFSCDAGFKCTGATGVNTSYASFLRLQGETSVHATRRIVVCGSASSVSMGRNRHADIFHAPPRRRRASRRLHRGWCRRLWEMRARQLRLHGLHSTCQMQCMYSSCDCECSGHGKASFH